MQSIAGVTHCNGQGDGVRLKTMNREGWVRLAVKEREKGRGPVVSGFAGLGMSRKTLHRGRRELGCLSCWAGPWWAGSVALFFSV